MNKYADSVGIETLTKARFPAGDERIVLGVVLEPGKAASVESIRKAAFAFMAGERKITAFGKAADVRVVESYIAPRNLTVEGQSIAAGSWVLGLRVRDDALWHKVRSGELAGLAPKVRKSAGSDRGLDGDTPDAVRLRVERAMLRLKPKQKAEVQARLAQATARAIALLRAVQTAATDAEALPSAELNRELRTLAASFSELAMPGFGVAKAGRKISGSRAAKFQKAIRILLEIAKELGLDGSEKPRVAWPLDLNKGRTENG